MRTIGLLGGMSWESTAEYYRVLNEGVKQSLGGLHSAKIVLYSVDFAPMEAMQQAGDWAAAADVLAQAACRVESAGADFLLLCTNTMHRVAAEVESAVSIPLLHIADATARRLNRRGVTKVGLLGTVFTMEQPFYRNRLSEHFGIEVLVPAADERSLVNQVIYDELCQGYVREQSRQNYLRIIDSLAARGAQAVILGCTEIGLLVRPEHTGVPLFDTTAIHAQEAVAYALDGQEAEA